MSVGLGRQHFSARRLIGREGVDLKHASHRIEKSFVSDFRYWYMYQL